MLDDTLGGGSVALGGLNRLIFGDITGAQDAAVDIDYIRWTKVGAFAPPPPGGSEATDGAAGGLPGESTETCSFAKEVDFDLTTTGASIEWRVWLADDDSAGSFLESPKLELADPSGGVAVSCREPVELMTGEGVTLHDLGLKPRELNVVRITVEDSQVNLYINGVLNTPVPLTPAASLASSSSVIGFGDDTVGSNAYYLIDYVRWTTQGALAPWPHNAPESCGDFDSYCFDADIGGPTDQQDCSVDLLDFMTMADEWQGCTMPSQADCEKVGGIRQIRQGTATVDGNLSEWSGAQWVALDQPYLGTAGDVAYAEFAACWDPVTDKIYAAVQVKDTDMIFEDYPPADGNTSDRLEIYSQGDAGGGTEYGPTFEEAQHYWVANGDMSGPWAGLAVVGDTNGIRETGLEYAVVVNEIDETITYEIGVPQYDYYDDPGGGASSEVTDLYIGKVVRFDLMVGSCFHDGTSGLDYAMLSENMMAGKDENAGRFAQYTLTDAAGSGLCGEWGYLNADLSGPAGVPDCLVDIYDAASLAAQWLWSSDPADPNCQVCWQ